MDHGRPEEASGHGGMATTHQSKQSAAIHRVCAVYKDVHCHIAATLTELIKGKVSFLGRDVGEYFQSNEDGNVCNPGLEANS